MNSFDGALGGYLQSFTIATDQVVREIWTVFQNAGPFQLIIIEIFAVFWLIKAFAKLIRLNKKRGAKVLKVRDELIDCIQGPLNEVNLLIAEGKPRVPQEKSVQSQASKVDGLLGKVKEIQDMHAGFQTEVIDSHIRIFNILNHVGDNNFLMPPERELVEPDSALPPLENEELS